MQVIDSRRRAHRADQIMTAVVWGCVIAVSVVFFVILGDLFIKGAGRISISFLLEVPRNAGRDGGIAPILVSTGLILLVALGTSVPLGVGTAILLSEFTSRDDVFGRVVRRSLDVLAGVPSIVFGLFGNAFFCIWLGMGFSILSGGLTLACMVLPILIRATEEGFRAVPDEYRRGAAALGMSRTRTLFSILLPCAVPGLMVGLVLGFGRAIAETAALIFTSGYVDRMPESLLDSGRSLAMHIYDLSMNVSGGEPNAYASALTLVLVLLVVNFTASWISHRYLARNVRRA